jgi:transposase
MAAKASGPSPDKRRKYDAAFKQRRCAWLRRAAARQSPRCSWASAPSCYRWQQDQAVAEVGSADVARAPEVQAFRAANKGLTQKVNMLKKALAIFAQPTT